MSTNAPMAPPGHERIEIVRVPERDDDRCEGCRRADIPMYELGIWRNGGVGTVSGQIWWGSKTLLCLRCLLDLQQKITRVAEVE